MGSSALDGVFKKTYPEGLAAVRGLYMGRGGNGAAEVWHGVSL